MPKRLTPVPVVVMGVIVVVVMAQMRVEGRVMLVTQPIKQSDNNSQVPRKLRKGHRYLVGATVRGRFRRVVRFTVVTRISPRGAGTIIRFRGAPVV